MEHSPLFAQQRPLFCTTATTTLQLLALQEQIVTNPFQYVNGGKTANWKQLALDAQLQTSYHNDINTFFKTITETIIAAAELNIRKKQATLPHPPVSWWNQNIKDAMKYADYLDSFRYIQFKKIKLPLKEREPE